MKELDEKTKMLNELIKNENESIQTVIESEFYFIKILIRKYKINSKRL